MAKEVKETSTTKILMVVVAVPLLYVVYLFYESAFTDAKAWE